MAKPVAPPLATAVYVTFVKVAGNVSAIEAPVTGWSGVCHHDRISIGRACATVVLPSVLVICRSACGVSVSVSVAELLAGVGSVSPEGSETVAVLLRVPVAAALTVPVTV